MCWRRYSGVCRCHQSLCSGSSNSLPQVSTVRSIRSAGEAGDGFVMGCHSRCWDRQGKSTPAVWAGERSGFRGTSDGAGPSGFSRVPRLPWDGNFAIPGAENVAGGEGQVLFPWRSRGLCAGAVGDWRREPCSQGSRLVPDGLDNPFRIGLAWGRLPQVSTCDGYLELS